MTNQEITNVSEKSVSQLRRMKMSDLSPEEQQRRREYETEMRHKHKEKVLKGTVNKKSISSLIMLPLSQLTEEEQQRVRDYRHRQYVKSYKPKRKATTMMYETPDDNKQVIIDMIQKLQSML